MIYIAEELQARDVWERKRSIEHGVAMLGGTLSTQPSLRTARGKLAHDSPGNCSPRVSCAALNYSDTHTWYIRIHPSLSGNDIVTSAVI